MIKFCKNCEKVKIRIGWLKERVLDLPEDDRLSVGQKWVLDLIDMAFKDCWVVNK